MAMNFGKGNRSIAFNPTSAFPLDARSYFESYAEAEAAALKALAAGSTDSVYYYGQTLVVVENGIASFYIIQPDNTLSAVAGANNATITVDANQFVFDSEGNLSLKGFADAAAGTVLTKNADGSFSWTVPVDAYSKTETDNKISAAVAAASHLKRKIVADLDEAKEYMNNNNDADQYIFMVPTGLQEADDKYDEYVVIIEVDSEGIELSRSLEKVGSWEVNLSEYAKTADVNTALESKVDKVDNARLITDDEATKLENIKDLIQSVDITNFNVDENGHLTLNNLPISKITNLEDTLNGKVDAKEGYTLLSPTDQEKLKALVIGDEGGLEISGTVNADNVQGLDEWITENAGSVIGLSENNFTTTLADKLNGIEAGAQKNYISSVTENFEVSVNGELRLVSITSSQVSDLADLLNQKASANDLLDLQWEVADLESDVSALKAALTWQTLPTTTT